METVLPYSSTGISGGYAFPWTLHLQPYIRAGRSTPAPTAPIGSVHL